MLASCDWTIWSKNSSHTLNSWTSHHNDFTFIFSALSITQWLAPEVISFIGSIIVFIVLKKASAIAVFETEDGVAPLEPVEPESELSPEKWQLLLGVGKVVSLIALCATGALQPSVLSFVYYAVFLGAATWWGCNRELERCEKTSHIRGKISLLIVVFIHLYFRRAFGIVLRVTLFFLSVHILSFLVYQNPWPQEFLEPNSTVPRWGRVCWLSGNILFKIMLCSFFNSNRILGWTAIYVSSCDNGTDIRVFNFDTDLDIDRYLNPIVLVLCYYVVAITSRVLLGPKVNFWF